MSNILSSIFSSSDITKQQKDATRRLLRNILLITITVTSAISFVDGILAGRQGTLYALLPLAIASTISLVYLRRQVLWPARIVIPIGSLIALIYLLWVGNGLHDIALSAFGVIITLAGLTLGGNGLIFFGLLCALAIVVTSIAELNGLIAYPFGAVGFSDATIISISVLAGTFLLRLLLNRLEQTIAQLQQSEQDQRNVNTELTALKESLEERVETRTNELAFANQRNEHRAKQFEAVAQVARATTLSENINELLPRLATVVSNQFDFYHTGIFLLDEKREYAILRASNSEGGKRMLARQHKLQIGQAGIVGFVSATGTPRIALDVGSDAVFFDNPDLPNTHSEMALPLRVADEIIGVLDVQSTEPNAFQDEDVEVLSTLADQVSIAIQNARSFESTQRLLKEAQKASSSYLQDAWRVLESEEAHVGYRASGEDIQVFTKPLVSAHVKEAVQNKRTVAESGKSAALAIPIRLRDEVIGVMDIRTPIEHDWDEDEVDIAEAVAERLSLALESSLLLKSTQKRAELERVTAEISGKIGATTQFDAILRTAAEELSRVLGGSDVLVQIQSTLPESDV
jgi:GAF domain-containing protein